MQFGPPKTLECPACKTPVRMPVLISGNSLGSVLWSDGKLMAPMLPNQPRITKCTRCATHFWLAQANTCTTPMPRWAFWKRPQWVRPLTASEYLAALDAGAASTPEEEIHLRMGAWHGWNDRYRLANPGAYEKPDYGMSANLQALSALMDTSDPNHLLMKAEIARELGNKEEAGQLLSAPIPPKYADVVMQMQEWVTAGNPQVQLFRDNLPSEEEREAKSLQEEEATKVRRTALLDAAQAVRALALERGMATPETVDDVIRNLDVAAFRELAHDYPNLSRIHFNPVNPRRSHQRYGAHRL